MSKVILFLLMSSLVLFSTSGAQPTYLGSFAVNAAVSEDTIINLQLPSYGKFIYKAFNPDTSADGVFTVGNYSSNPPWYHIYMSSGTENFYYAPLTRGISNSEVEAADSSLFSGDYEIQLHYNPARGTENSGIDSVQVFFETSDILAGAEFLISITSGGTEQNSVETTFAASSNSYIVAHTVQTSPGGGGHSIYIDSLAYTCIMTGNNGYTDFLAFRVPPGEHILQIVHEDDIWGDNSGTRQVDLYVRSDDCAYVLGDVNNSSSYNGLDITYGVAYFKGGDPPLYECECTPGETWYVSGDVNGDCVYNGLDIGYGLNYLKGGPALIPCGACPPAD